MAVYFTLTPRVDPEHGPMSMQDIDKGICDFLGIECHPKFWACSWYDCIGFWLAYGHTWQQIDNRLLEYLQYASKEEKLREVQLIAISQWLQLNYIANCWANR